MQFTIAQARRYAGLSQDQMGKFIGIHRQTYMKIEKDPTKATIGQLNKISDITGIPVGDFILANESTKVDYQENRKGSEDDG